MVEFGSIQSLSLAFTSIYVFITACRCSDIRISVGLSHNVSHPGDNVTLTCRVQGAQKETAVVWEKLPVTGADLGREIIGRDDQLSEEYRKLTKYDIFVIELPHVVISILTINHVGVEESGLIGCSISVEDAIYRDATLFQVFKQPSDIWCSCEQCTKDSEISAIEGDNLEVQCIVRRVQPLPHISAHLGHKSLTGHHTVINRTTNVHCGQQRLPASGEGNAGARHCPVHFDYDVQFRLANHLVSYLDDGRELTIAVSLGHSGWLAMVKRLPVNVRFAPKFNCSNPTDAEFRSRNLVIVCRLLSKPALSNTPFVWWRHIHQGNRTIHVGQTIDGYELREKGTLHDAGERPSVESVVHGRGSAVAYTLELVIHETQAIDFQTPFHFYAQNEIGSTTETIRIRQIATTTKSQPARQSSGRPHGRHTKKPSSQAQLINEATIWTIHPITSMTFFFISCLF